jgi:hypothetical protein
MDNSTKAAIKERVRSILKLQSRIDTLSNDMNSGDVSPFLLELLGKQIILQNKIGTSLNTTMGMSFYEQTCKTLGETVGFNVELQKKVTGYLSDEVKDYLKLTDSIDYSPDRDKEIAHLKTIVKGGKNEEYPDSTVDVYITKPDKSEILIDITTVKPNKKEFRVLKEKLLRWTAMRLSQDPSIDVQAYIAIPYNPESSTHDGIDYSRHKKYYDRKDILVGEELWRIVSNDQVGILDMVEIFKELGDEMRVGIETTMRDL